MLLQCYDVFCYRLLWLFQTRFIIIIIIIIIITITLQQNCEMIGSQKY